MEGGATEPKRAVMESPRALADEALLVAGGVAIATGALLAVAIHRNAWPWWYAGLSGGGVGAWAFFAHQWEEEWHPWVATGVGVVLGLAPLLHRNWSPWDLSFALVAGGIAFALVATGIVKDHRGLLREIVRQQPLPVPVEVPKSSPWKPSPVCFAQSATRKGNKMESAATVQAQVVEDPEYTDAMNFGYFIDLVFPEPGKQGLPPRQQNWATRIMPSGDKLGRDGLREYKRRLEKAGLAHFASNAPNAELILDGTREEAVACFREIIILPGEDGQE